MVLSKVDLLFISGRFEPSVHSFDNSNITITLTELTAGKPKLDSFTFKLNGYVSPAVAVGAAADVVGSAVKSFFGPNCPEGIQRSLGGAYLY